MIQDVLHEQTKYSYYFQSLTIIRWTLMVTQLAMNATMTALGSLDQDGTIIVSYPGSLRLIRPFIITTLTIGSNSIIILDNHCSDQY